MNINYVECLNFSRIDLYGEHSGTRCRKFVMPTRECEIGSRGRGVQVNEADLTVEGKCIVGLMVFGYVYLLFTLAGWPKPMPSIHSLASTGLLVNDCADGVACAVYRVSNISVDRLCLWNSSTENAARAK